MVGWKPYVNQWLDVQDRVGKWYEAEIVDIRGLRIKVHYKGWKAKYDEWLHVQEQGSRIAGLNTKVKQRVPPDYDLVLELGTELDVCDTQNKWFLGEVQELSEEVAFVHYIGWPTKYDEWISRTSWRLQQKGSYVMKPRSRKPNEKRAGRSKVPEIVQKSKPQTSHPDATSPTSTQERAFEKVLRDRRGWKIERMGEDGNCLFRSISHQVYGTEEHHVLVRRKCVEYMRYESFYFQEFTTGGPEDFQQYCENMIRNGIWGGHIEIQAMSEIYQRPVEIYSYGAEPMKVVGNSFLGNAVIRLSYHQQSHYNSITDGAIIEHPPTPGEVENGRIAWSKSRTSDAEMEMNLADSQFVEQALEASRKEFAKHSDKEFEAVVKRSLDSLREIEQNQLDEALKNSMQQQERDELNQALLASKKQEEDDLNQALLASLPSSDLVPSGPDRSLFLLMKTDGFADDDILEAITRANTLNLQPSQKSEYVKSMLMSLRF